MIRRGAIALFFAVLGLFNLLLVDDTITWLCSHFAGICRTYTGPCPGIDACTPDTLMSIALSAIYFGPSVVFAAVSYFFSAKKRGAAVWATLTMSLVVLHIVAMFAVMQLTAK